MSRVAEEKQTRTFMITFDAEEYSDGELYLSDIPGYITSTEVNPNETTTDAEGERHSGYLQLHELVKDAPEGVRRAVTNDKQRVLANGSFALHPSMLRHLLIRAYEQGVRQSHTS